MRRLIILLCLAILAAVIIPDYAISETGSAATKKNKKAKTHNKKKAASVKKVVKGKREKPVAKVSRKHESTPIPGPALLKDMRYWSNPDYTRIAVTFDREARFEYHQLPQNIDSGMPPRVYIDITGARIGGGVKDIPIGDGLLKTARVGQYKSDTVRVVLDMESIKDFKIFTFSEPFRIIVDVRGERREVLSATQPPVIKTAPVAQTPIRKEPVVGKIKTTPNPAPGKIRRVVVDMGHGGHDPGAIGRGGTREKDVVLQIGQRLSELLKDDLGLDVVLTRKTDVFLELPERTAIANQVGADLFISIHANASPNRNTNGIETYYLNLAKTEKAAQLAATENGTSLEKVSLLQAVLFDLMANYKINDSAHLAEEVQKSLCKHLNKKSYAVKNLGVKQGPFYVLVGANMPSILVETAFLSNEKEEKRLRDPEYLEAVAEGIVEGIKGYITTLK
jgi:N-acetylmuramoyl-L-alanine amidase